MQFDFISHELASSLPQEIRVETARVSIALSAINLFLLGQVETQIEGWSTTLKENTLPYQLENWSNRQTYNYRRKRYKEQAHDHGFSFSLGDNVLGFFPWEKEKNTVIIPWDDRWHKLEQFGVYLTLLKGYPSEIQDDRIVFEIKLRIEVQDG